MIRYALSCVLGHPFEGWFATSADFDAQADRGLVTCPLCGSRQIAKQIMAPAVAGTKRREGSEAPAEIMQAMMEAQAKVRTHVLETFDDVGDAFAKEARAIHEGKAEPRGVYGQATVKDVADLVADGVPVAPLPTEPPKKSDMN